VVIWGAGWRAASLKAIQEMLPRPVLYWGDIDKEGYEIYGHLRSHIPDLQPTLMSLEVIKQHKGYSIPKEPYCGPFREVLGLQQEYELTCQEGLCIEQEKIHDRPY
jgi:hypothetical protein